MSERDAYLKKLEAKLEEWDAEIDKLQAKAKGAEADTQRQYEDQLNELRTKRKETIEKDGRTSTLGLPRLRLFQNAELAVREDHCAE